MKIKVFNIDWDTDGENIELPNEVEMNFEENVVGDRENLEMLISNNLSDEYGFCHFGFEYSLQKSVTA